MFVEPHDLTMVIKPYPPHFDAAAHTDSARSSPPAVRRDRLAWFWNRDTPGASSAGLPLPSSCSTPRLGILPWGLRVINTAHAVSSPVAKSHPERVATHLDRNMPLAQVKHLGDGAFASVDECALRGQRVAVKRLKPELFSNDTELANFVTEGTTIAKLSHPCVLPNK